MTAQHDFIVTDFSSDREKKVTRYVMNHPNCSINKVIVFCSETGGPNKKTVERILLKLEEDGIITERPNPNDKRAFCLTVASGNLLEILPKDLENIFSRLLAFTKLIKKMIENGYLLVDKPLPKHYSEIASYEARRSLPFLPYYVTEIITSFYMFYFSFVLPQKIENQKLITKLYSWYFENLSKVYSFLLTELGNTPSYSGEIAVMVKSKINMGHIKDERPGLYPVYRTMRVGRINGIEEQLYDVLDQLWKRNEDSCKLLYSIDLDLKIQDKHFISSRKNDKLFEDKDRSQILDNETLKKIHLLIDYYIYQQEKGEEEAERDQFDAEDTYNPFD